MMKDVKRDNSKHRFTKFSARTVQQILTLGHCYLHARPPKLVDGGLNFQLLENNIHFEYHGPRIWDAPATIIIGINDKIKLTLSNVLNAVEMFTTGQFITPSPGIMDVLVNDVQVDEKTAFAKLLAVSDLNHLPRSVDSRSFEDDLLLNRITHLSTGLSFKRTISTGTPITVTCRDSHNKVFDLQTDAGLTLRLKGITDTFYANLTEFFLASKSEVNRRFAALLDRCELKCWILTKEGRTQINLSNDNEDTITKCILYNENPELVMLIGHYNEPEN